MFRSARKKLRSLKRRTLSLTRLRNKKRYLLDYEPELGQRSNKAKRLVDFCLGTLKDQPLLPCTEDRKYLNRRSILFMETDRREIRLYSHADRSAWDQKKIIQAFIAQRALIPSGLRSWIIRGDGSGKTSDPAQGLHITGMRPATRRDLVLAPTACRDRYLGPNLTKQMDALRESWVPWEAKSDTAWWGGALTGDWWKGNEPRTLTRREVLTHFQSQPSQQVSLHLTELSGGLQAPPGVELQERFTKQSAFSHKCLLLLPGNDIASGSSWYFAGNSVVLMPQPHLEHILYFEMEPWEHYVPLENDPADILVKLRWVLDNQAAARQIVANSHERLRWLCGQEYLWACNEVLRRITPHQ